MWEETPLGAQREARLCGFGVPLAPEQGPRWSEGGRAKLRSKIPILAGSTIAGAVYFLFSQGDAFWMSFLIAISTAFVAAVREARAFVDEISTAPISLERLWPGGAWRALPRLHYHTPPSPGGWEALPSQWERLGIWVALIFSRVLNILVLVLLVLAIFLKSILTGLLRFVQRLHGIPLALLILLADWGKLLVAGASILFGLVTIKLASTLLFETESPPYSGQTHREVRP